MKHLIKTIREQPDANAASNAGHVAIHAQPAPLAVVGLVPARARRELLGLRPVAADNVAEINSRGDTTLAKDYAGEIHRVGVDLEQKAVAAVVVLGRDALTRDVLVPLSRSKRSRTTN